jgi:hypothetical protein
MFAHHRPGAEELLPDVIQGLEEILKWGADLKQVTDHRRCG